MGVRALCTSTRRGKEAQTTIIKRRRPWLAVVALVATTLAATAAAAAPPNGDALLANIERDLACCVQLGANMQLHYARPAPGGKAFDFALLGAVPPTSWLAFGPADPRANDRFMGSADCAAGGISDVTGKPWAADLFLSSYSPCDTSEPPAVGVCPDATINANPRTGATLASTPAAIAGLNSVELVAGGRAHGVTLLRLRRNLTAHDALDHAIDPSAALNYVWATGGLSPAPAAPGNSNPALRLKQHAASKNAYGVLAKFQLASCPSACPTKLQGDAAADAALAAAAAPAAARSGDAAAGARVLNLDGGGARVAWAVEPATAAGPASLRLSFRALRRSTWAALGFGTGMVGARALVVWKDPATGAAKAGAYDMVAYSAAGVKAVAAAAGPGTLAAPNAGAVRKASIGPDGLVTFDVVLPLPAGAKGGRVPLIYALGNKWTQPPTDAAQHFEASTKATELDLGAAAAAARSPAPAAAKPPAATAPPPARSSGDGARFATPACALKIAVELERLGDGWCDAGAPYNTAECGWDGGDCCAVKTSKIYDCRDPSSPNFGRSSPRGVRFPAPRNPRYTAGLARELSTKELVQTYNNFYEFTDTKSVFEFVTPESTRAMSLSAPGFPGWQITIDGLVATPMKLDIRQLLQQFHMEERVYRHRCVEAWAIVVPWVGFPLRKLVAAVRPLPGARYVRFESDTGSYLPQVGATIEPGSGWPYVEGLTIPEAWTDLAFVSIGQFNATLPPQSGSPIRLNLPWKYGFKSVKSIRRITFTDEQPDTYWHKAAPSEYGFYANINPRVPHPRWSQATEQLLVTSPVAQRVARTVIFNGYGAEVKHLYKNSTPDEREFFF